MEKSTLLKAIAIANLVLSSSPSYAKAPEDTDTEFVTEDQVEQIEDGAYTDNLNCGCAGGNCACK